MAAISTIVVSKIAFKEFHGVQGIREFDSVAKEKLHQISAANLQELHYPGKSAFSLRFHDAAMDRKSADALPRGSLRGAGFTISVFAPIPDIAFSA